MRAAVLLVLMLCPQDAKPPPQDPLKQDIEKAIKDLSSDQFLRSQEARADLVEIGRKAIPQLLAAITLEDVALMKDGRKLAGTVVEEGDKVKITKDGKTDTVNKVDVDRIELRATARLRHVICEVLGEIRDGSTEVVKALVARLTDNEEYGTSIAAAAAAALAAIGDESAAPEILKVLTLAKSPAETDKPLKYECIRALGILRHKPASEIIRKALEDKKTTAVDAHDEYAHTIAAAAADALGKMRAADAADDLGKLLSDITMDPFSDRPLGWHAARALQRILWDELHAKDPKDAKLQPLDVETGDTMKVIEAWRKWYDEKSASKKADETREKIKLIAQAIDEFKKDNEKYPTVLQDLIVDPKTAKKWRVGGYYKFTGEAAKAFRDAWEHEILYREPGTGGDYDVFSYGKDFRAWGGGLDADLYNHDGWKKALGDKTKKNMDEVVKAIEAFKTDNGVFPDRLIDLIVKPAYPTKKWEKPYLPAEVKDGFDQPFVYTKPGKDKRDFDLISLGADRAVGGTDADADVTYTKP